MKKWLFITAEGTGRSERSLIMAAASLVESDKKGTSFVFHLRSNGCCWQVCSATRPVFLCGRDIFDSLTHSHTHTHTHTHTTLLCSRPSYEVNCLSGSWFSGSRVHTLGEAAAMLRYCTAGRGFTTQAALLRHTIGVPPSVISAGEWCLHGPSVIVV